MKVKRIIIHCSDSLWGDVPTIRDWHVNGNGWRDIGYNAVIYNGFQKNSKEYTPAADGLLVEGRALDFSVNIDMDEVAAHARGFNRDSIGVCVIGKDTFTDKQKETLILFCKMWKRIVPDIEIVGHYEVTNSGKTCPNMYMDNVRRVVAESSIIMPAKYGF